MAALSSSSSPSSQPQQSQPQQPGRPLGFMERYYLCRDTCGYSTYGFTLSVRYERRATDAALSKALRALMAKQPLLCANAYRTAAAADPAAREAEDARANGANYELRLVPQPIVFSELVQRKAVPAMDAAVFHSLSLQRTPSDNAAAPSWYLTVFEVAAEGEVEGASQQYLTFASNHVLFDGTSAANFFKDLAVELAAVEDDGTAVEEVLFDAQGRDADVFQALTPPAEHVVPLYASSAWFKVRTIAWNVLLPASARSALTYLYPKSAAEAAQLRQHPLLSVGGLRKAADPAGFDVVRLDKEATARALQRAKSMGVTFTPFIAACAHAALEKAVRPLVEGAAPSFNFSLVVCGRRYYPEAGDKTRYGVYVASIDPCLSPPSPSSSCSVVDAAKSLASALAEGLASRACFFMAGMLQLVNAWDYVAGQHRTATPKTVEVSNLGVIAAPAAGWAIEDAFFGQAPAGCYITLSVVSTPAGGVNIVVSHDPKLNAAFGGSVAASFCAALTQQLNGI